MVTAGPDYQTESPYFPMNRFRLVLVCLLPALLTALPLRAQDAMPAPNWARRDALQAAGTANALAELKPLFELARAGRDDEVLELLQRVAGAEQWPQPARERILHAFALGLGDLPPGSVGPGVLDYLLAWQPRTRVPHPDNELVGVPLFDIGAAANGAVNAWARQSGQEAARSLLARHGEDPGAAPNSTPSSTSSSTPASTPASNWIEKWIDAYLAASPARRQGFADALDDAPPAQLRALSKAAREALARAPDLTLVAVRCAVLLADAALLRQAIVAGRGPGLASALQWAGQSLGETERIELLQGLARDAAPTSAALAIAALAPGLLHYPEVANLLFELLGDPALGAAAALTLSRSDSPAVRDRLAGLAGGGDLAARRAAIALNAGVER
jgi:hypothetical protein